MQLGIHVGPLTREEGAVSGSVPCHWIPLPPPGLPGWAAVREDVPGPVEARCSRAGWYPRRTPLSLLRRDGGNRRRVIGFVSVGLGREEGGGCVRDQVLVT